MSPMLTSSDIEKEIFELQEADHNEIKILEEDLKRKQVEAEEKQKDLEIRQAEFMRKQAELKREQFDFERRQSEFEQDKIKQQQVEVSELKKEQEFYQAPYEPLPSAVKEEELVDLLFFNLVKSSFESSSLSLYDVPPLLEEEKKEKNINEIDKALFDNQQRIDRLLELILE